MNTTLTDAVAEYEQATGLPAEEAIRVRWKSHRCEFRGEVVLLGFLSSRRQGKHYWHALASPATARAIAALKNASTP
jgi:hypothetical protein